MNTVEAPSSTLSQGQAETFAAHVAELTAAGLPLAPGLRAAASETSGRLARALRAAARVSQCRQQPRAGES